MTAVPRDVREFFAGVPFGLQVYTRVAELLEPAPDVAVRVTRSQVAFRRRRGFAWLWLPGRYLAHPGAAVVLTLALGRRHPSPRFKEVVHPAPAHWMHHLEVRSLEELDAEVAAWLAEAAGRAG